VKYLLDAIASISVISFPVNWACGMNCGLTKVGLGVVVSVRGVQLGGRRPDFGGHVFSPHSEELKPRS
jgi:hypothetical protein